MDQIIVIVDIEAQVKVEVKGHAGPGCRALSREIEQALGETIRDEPTREIHQTAETQVRVHRRG